MIQLGRSKDKQRLASMMEDYGERVDWDRFHSLLSKHGLSEKFARFKRTLDA
jgi:ribosome-binding protein aMBF1 (putative translation factor)